MNTKTKRSIHLDGRTLEGGGQLVRIAIALSSITNQPITITNVRSNRHGKKGLKASHLAAVNFLAELTGSSVSGAEVGSTFLAFGPSLSPSSGLQSEYDIRLDTAGAVFLIFQAVYPFLLYAAREEVRLNLTGGTNVSFAPSYDYIAQVLGPNLARLGLPPLEIKLQKRGWGKGNSDLGKVTLVVHPLERNQDGEKTRVRFPPMKMDDRGRLTRIDVTILAPDDLLDVSESASTNSPNTKKRKATDTVKRTLTARQLLEEETVDNLRHKLTFLPSSLFQAPSSSSNGDPTSHVPVILHTSERTHHRSHMYVLIAAQTSTGFKIGQDALLGSFRIDGPKGRNTNPMERLESEVKSLAKCAVDRFAKEIYSPHMEADANPERIRPCVDEHMRDQLIIFEALGKLQNENGDQTQEDERYWSLHTQTAQWVCREILEQT